MKKFFFSPEDCHRNLINKIKPELKFNKNSNINVWKRKLRTVFLKLIGDFPERSFLNIRLQKKIKRKDFIEIHYVFSSEPFSDIPVVLLLPLKKKRPPVVICLQGHNTGMHISFGKIKYKGDEEQIKTNRDYALQAVKMGFASLSVEQRCFGIRQDMRDGKKKPYKGCHHATMNALLIGRTMIGERVWDVIRSIDFLEKIDLTDNSRILITGDSGGGIISYYAAAVDKRISAVMPVCGFAGYALSICEVEHCEDNYIPSAWKYFDMPDIAGLIVPRPLLIVTGRYDNYFPLKSVLEGMKRIKEIYKAFGEENRCALVIGNKGHQFYPELAWDAIRRLWPCGFI